MADERILQRLREILSEITGQAASALTAGSTSNNTDGWDSVANLGLMGAVEDEFQVTIATRDVMQLRSLGDIAAYLEGAATRS